jgi:hypothetical protein
MQSEDFDKKIKEAAEHHHPAYDEKAWDKMEKLLDKHMPTEKDNRRRIFFFLLLFLGLAVAGGGIYYVSKNKTKGTAVSLNGESKKEAAHKKTEQAPGASEKLNTDKPADEANGTDADTKTPGVSNSDPEQENDRDVKSVDDAVTQGSSEGTYIKQTASANKKFRSTGDHLKANKQGSKKIKEAIDISHVKVNKDHPYKKETTQKAVDADLNTVTNNVSKSVNQQPKENGIDNSIVAAKPVQPDSALQQKGKDTVKSEATKDNNVAQLKPKPGKQKKAAFAITFTAMPDLSTVGIKKAGKVEVAYGAGLSYTINKFSIRSGFYVGRKIYTAGPDDYHPPKHNWTYYVDLDKVDANCKVYEIPLLIGYNITETKKYNWFISTGLSTYIMRNETYDYYYKDNTGANGWSKTVINNQNKHFFSIVNLSTGYERKLTNTLSLTAEPYLKVPVDGIGFGKIQLNSAGIAVTLSIKPFTPKK